MNIAAIYVIFCMAVMFGGLFALIVWPIGSRWRKAQRRMDDADLQFKRIMRERRAIEAVRVHMWDDGK